MRNGNNIVNFGTLNREDVTPKGKRLEYLGQSEDMPKDRAECGYCGSWGDCQSNCAQCGASIGLSDRQKAWLHQPRFLIRDDE